MTLKAQLANAIIPVARGAMRTAPYFRKAIWESVVEGRLAWRAHPFLERANFGAMFSGNTADVLQRYVYYFGCWEPQIEAVIAEWLQPGDTFIDIGANIGYFTLLASSLVGPTGHVVAIEAATATYGYLTENVKRNSSAGNIRRIHAAVSNREGSVTLHAGPGDNSGMASILRSDGSGNEEVEAKPLGALLTEQELRATRLIKIDVEGAEALVIEGMESILLQLQSSAILVELNPALASAERTLDVLARHSWRAYEILPTDSLENYFHTPLKPQLIPLTKRPTRRMDVLFRK